jgi:sigma-B regulation protein RsbU (phosphoserine phosphatase)
MSPSSPRILLCAGRPNLLEELAAPLQPIAAITGLLLDAPTPERNGYHLIVVDGSAGGPRGLELCRRLRSGPDEEYQPLLFVAEPGMWQRQDALEAGADACLSRPLAPGELLAQVRTLLRTKEAHDRLAERAAEVHRVNRRLQQAYQQIEQEMELAHRIQSSFLPHTLPEVPQVRFAAHYVLCGQVGGDFYDVFRLDEHHVGFYVADAMGHGVAASLLTIFVKKGVKPKEVFGRQYRLVPPGEVLGKLNRDMIEQRLSDNPFITMVYGLLDHRAGTVRLARAGHPYPLYVPRTGAAQLWQQHGLLLGVADAEFAEAEYPLRPGDKLLLYSDGIDHAVFDGRPAGIESLKACAERHRALPVQAFVAQVARELTGGAAPTDDLTLLAFEMIAPPGCSSS